ncbi:endonuclease/exonuclease/phosphatase family protein [Myxococcaceae bacterium JPH2]|nr:endonuclease/exonuclease/phosphatase family protein [Myxococcaceae bacterium JPH2]
MARLLCRVGAWFGLLLAAAGCDGRSIAREPEDVDPCAIEACPPPTPPVARADVIRIAAYNVHRLFDTVCDSAACGGSNYEALPSPEAFALQVQQLATAIASLDADIVMLEEVETQASLDALQALLPRYPHAVLGETGAPASVDVAVLSAFPITRVTSHYREVLTRPDGTSTRFSRDLLEVHVSAKGGETIVFPAHFRSKVSDDPGRREAEANGARTIVSATAAASPRALVVLGGDLNDVPGSPPLVALEAGGALSRVAADRPSGDTWTYAYNGQLQAIDHLYLARSGGAYVPGSFRVARDRSGLGGSDHGAVFADFQYAAP